MPCLLAIEHTLPPPPSWCLQLSSSSSSKPRRETQQEKKQRLFPYPAPLLWKRKNGIIELLVMLWLPKLAVQGLATAALDGGDTELAGPIPPRSEHLAATQGVCNFSPACCCAYELVNH